jgi:nucleoside-diphosphate-sugar epimerase
MKILITGAGGFLGKQIVRSLLRQGQTELLRLHFRSQAPGGFIEALQQEFPQARIEPVGANLLARGSFDAIFDGIDTVIHAAAGMRGAAADMFANTVIGSRNVFEACERAGVRRIVLISSFAVFKTEQMKPGEVLDETIGMEPVGVERGPYGYAKTRQEYLLHEFQKQHGFETVVLRPGVIYGPGGGALSPRVGLKIMNFIVSLGGNTLLPLTYVDNCADAIARAATHAPSGSVFPVVDDDVPTCKAYLKGYLKHVQKLRVLPVPRWVFRWGAAWLVRYHERSKGQLPAIFTPYIVRSMYTPIRYSNDALKRIGWTQRVSTEEGLQRTFQWLKGQLDKA